jgi:hypothetical protein
MNRESPVFEETCNDYLSRIAGIDLEVVAARLGAKVENGRAVIPLLGRPYRVSLPQRLYPPEYQGRHDYGGSDR